MASPPRIIAPTRARRLPSTPAASPHRPPSLPTRARAQSNVDGKELHRSQNGGPNKPMTKKGGAGGKGTWGDQTINDGPASMDKGDPNFDPEEQAGVVMEASN